MNKMINRIKHMFEESKNDVIFLENEKANTEFVKTLNINEETVIGQIILNFKKLSVNGYLRILSGDDRVELNIIEFNKKVKSKFIEGKLIFAYDIWGGVFAVNTDTEINDESNIFYFAPDTLEWEDLDMNYQQFLMWICTDEFNGFHSSFGWRDINNDISVLDENDAILV